MTAWANVELGSVCQIINGGTPKSEVVKYWGGNNQWITPKDMGKLQSKFVEETERQITDAGLQNCSAKLSPPQSVILSSRAPIGHLAINLRPMATNQGCKTLIPSATLDFLYLYYFLSHSKQLLNDLGSGTTFKELSSSKLSEVPIPLPPLAIQKAIVAKLDAAFASIDISIAAAEKSAENAKLLFEAELEDLLIRDDADWQSYSFDEICEIQSKLVDPRESEHQHKLHIGAGNIDAGTGNLQNVITAQQENLISGKFTFTQDMVLYSKIRPYLRKVAMPDFDGLCSADVYPLWPKPTVVSRVYLFYVLLSNYFTTYAISGSERAGMPKVNRDHLFSFKIKLPNISVQKDIERRISNLSIQCDILASSQTAKASALSQLKQSLLQQAFNGQLVDA